MPYRYYYANFPLVVTLLLVRHETRSHPARAMMAWLLSQIPSNEEEEEKNQ